jgi:ATP-dependent DNA helicase PIF1
MCSLLLEPIFIDGPGGTGKTHLYKCILAHYRSQQSIVVAVASSGIASLLLPGGRTAHSRFKIPIKVSSSSTCNLSLKSEEAKLIKESKLILWDEAPMMHRHAFEALDRSFRDITKVKDKPFGGKKVVFGGDFRQILPVIINGM